MRLFGAEVDVDRGLRLATRVHRKYAPVFDALPERDRAALALYFLPHRSRKDVLEVSRPRVIKWYCPFADQRTFPSGHRYCINVYTGCEHGCRYCYAAGYAPRRAACKKAFRADLAKDLEALDAYDVPPAPVHLSNSTDPLQSLERTHRHTLAALGALAGRRHRFTTVTVITKNPARLTEPEYLRALCGAAARGACLPGRRVPWWLSRSWKPAAATRSKPGIARRICSRRPDPRTAPPGVLGPKRLGRWVPSSLRQRVVHASCVCFGGRQSREGDLRY